MKHRSLTMTLPLKQKSWVSTSELPAASEYTDTDLDYSLDHQELNGLKHVSQISSTAFSKHQLADLECDEESYISDFENFTQNNLFKNSIGYGLQDESQKARVFDKEESKENFDDELQQNLENTLIDSIKDIDKTNTLEKLFKNSKLSDLSGEITKIAGFVKSIPILKPESRKSAMIFLVSLDYLVKGLFTHWQITLADESKKFKYSKIRRKMQDDALIMKDDLKYNILIGDQFHAMAYHLTARLGSNELSTILTRIEENFAKIIFRDGYNGWKTHNLKKLYKHFYNYLPTFFGQGFKGIAIISEMRPSSIDQSFKLGIEYGFWMQFGIFSYIMSAIENRREKEVVKTKLKKISSLVQLLSIETLQEILNSVSILKYKDFKKEFAQLSVMHAHKWFEILEEMDVEEEMRLKMMAHISEFTDELIITTGVNIHT